MDIFLLLPFLPMAHLLLKSQHLNMTIAMVFSIHWLESIKTNSCLPTKHLIMMDM